MDMQQIENKVIMLLAAFEGSLPGQQLSEMRELAEAGEPGIALENLCTQLYEYDVIVSHERQQEIALVGKAMGIAESTWQKLEQGSQ